ncbi:hypothetical protein BH24ACT9_BH24ACT9_00950 [soil metagenome]
MSRISNDRVPWVAVLVKGQDQKEPDHTANPAVRTASAAPHSWRFTSKPPELRLAGLAVYVKTARCLPQGSFGPPANSALLAVECLLGLALAVLGAAQIDPHLVEAAPGISELFVQQPYLGLLLLFGLGRLRER